MKIACVLSLILLAGLTGLCPLRAADVGFYGLDKIANYDQVSAATPYLDPLSPYLLTAGITPGSTGSLLLTSSSLTTPADSTYYFTNNSAIASSVYGEFFEENFSSKSALDSAWGSGTYNLSVLTTLPNQYPTQLAIGSDNYPTLGQITSATNATWSGNCLVITDPTQPVTLNWSSISSADYFIDIFNTSIEQTVSGTSIIIPANTFSSGQYYQGFLQFINPVSGSNTNPISGTSGTVQYENQVQFIIQAGTPTTKNTYTVEQDHVLTQTSNSAPTSTLGSFGNEDPEPYSFLIKSPTAGTVSGPNSSVYPIAFTPTVSTSNGGACVYTSGPVSSLSNLQGSYADGSYTFPDSQSVTLNGDTFPNIPQVTAVNGATPVWNAQGRLVLDPTISNTLTWTSFNTESNPNWEEEVKLNSDNGGNVNLKQTAGLATASPSTFNTLVIPASTLSSGSTYTGYVEYVLASSASVSGSTVHAAGYATETYFSILAQPAAFSGGFTPSLYFQNGTSLGILTVNPTFAPSAWQGVGAMNSGWVQGAIGDITGNGLPAIIFQNGTLIGAVTLNASGTPSSWIGIGGMNTGWELRGAAYISGDGNLDLIFQNGTLIGYLEVNSSGAPISWTGVGAMGSGWELRAVADLTGNGRPDLIFQNGTSIGALQVSTSGTPTAWNGIGALSSGWTLASAVDVNGDGQPELIFQNGTLIGGLTINTSFQPVAWYGIGAMGSGWTLPGDY